MKPLLISLLVLAFAGCAATPRGPERPLRDSMVALALGGHSRIFGLDISPVRIVEDSRCPTGVQCIQAGTVRLLVRIEDRSGTREVTLTLGKPVALANGGWIDLAAVCPYPRHPNRITRESYLFMLAFNDQRPSELKLPIVCEERAGVGQ